MIECKRYILLSAHYTRISLHLYETQSTKVQLPSVYKRISTGYDNNYNPISTITYELVWSVGYNGMGYDFKQRSYMSYKERNCR